MPHRQNRVPLLPLRALAALAAAALLAGCQDSKPPQEAQARPVLVTSLHYGTFSDERTYVGVVKPRIESDLGFRVAGKIARRLVDVGATVAVGQPLAILDGVDLRLQAEQAEAEQRAASGSLAQAVAAETRATNLHKGGWATDAQIEQARAAADEARGRLLRADRAVELARNGLSYATLLADAPGIVTATLVEPGQVVAAGQPAIRVARVEEREVVVALPEASVGIARNGVASVSLWTAPGKAYVAKLRELSPSADPVTRTFLAKFSILDAGDDVLIGMTANLILKDPAREPVARVPLAALFNKGDGPGLYVVNEAANGVTFRPVTVKGYGSNEAEITGGVADGAQIVALGVQKLDPGQKVRVVSSLSF